MHGKKPPPARRGIGDNSEGATIEVEVRLFNSLAHHLRGRRTACTITLPAGGTIGDILTMFGIAVSEVFLVMRNGRDLTPELGGAVRTDFRPSPGDVIALSGPVPYSWGYGAPVV